MAEIKTEKHDAIVLSSSSEKDWQREFVNLLKNTPLPDDELLANLGLYLSTRFPKYGYVFLTSQDCHGLCPRNDTPDDVFARSRATKQSQRPEIRYRIYETVYLVPKTSHAYCSSTRSTRRL